MALQAELSLLPSPGRVYVNGAWNIIQLGNFPTFPGGTMDDHGSPDDNFFKVYHPHIESKAFTKIKPASAKLYLYLCHLRNRYGDVNGIFYRSDPLISSDTGLSIKTIGRARRDLSKNGFLRCNPASSHYAHRYQINDFEKEK